MVFTFTQLLVSVIWQRLSCRFLIASNHSITTHYILSRDSLLSIRYHKVSASHTLQSKTSLREAANVTNVILKPWLGRHDGHGDDELYASKWHHSMENNRMLVRLIGYQGEIIFVSYDNVVIVSSEITVRWNTALNFIEWVTEVISE